MHCIALLAHRCSTQASANTYNLIKVEGQHPSMRFLPTDAPLETAFIIKLIEFCSMLSSSQSSTSRSEVMMPPKFDSSDGESEAFSKATTPPMHLTAAKCKVNVDTAQWTARKALRTCENWRNGIGRNSHAIVGCERVRDRMPISAFVIEHIMEVDVHGAAAPAHHCAVTNAG